MKAIVRLTFIALTLSISPSLYAQEALAKLRYQEAEEAFNAGDFSLTLKKLDEVVGILKDENPRTLYLRIQAQKAMLPADPCQNEEVAIQLMNSCKLYVSRYEKVEALQDNAIDVYKIMDASGVTPTTAAERTAYEEIKKQWASLDYTSLRKLYEAHTAAYNSCFTRNAARELTLLKKLSEKNNAILTAGERATDDMLLDYLNQEIECKRYFGKSEFTANYKTIYSSLRKSEENVTQAAPEEVLTLIPVDQFTYGTQKLRIMQDPFNDYPYSLAQIEEAPNKLCPNGWRLPFEDELRAYFNSLPEDLKQSRFGLIKDYFKEYSDFIFQLEKNNYGFGVLEITKITHNYHPAYNKNNYLRWTILKNYVVNPLVYKGSGKWQQKSFDEDPSKPFCKCIYNEGQL